MGDFNLYNFVPAIVAEHFINQYRATKEKSLETRNLLLTMLLIALNKARSIDRPIRRNGSEVYYSDLFVNYREYYYHRLYVCYCSQWKVYLWNLFFSDK
ncbi:hypothetical protein ACH3XW_26650 [Acanthocheilonema viteae]